MHHVHFKEIDSTSTWLKQNLNEIPDTGFLWVTAEAQTGGRGRHGKSWVSEPGAGLWMSFGYWAKSKSDGPLLSLEIAKYLTSFFESIGLKTTVKPPNDILVNGKKLCGILCETAWRQERLAHIIGIGINVERAPKNLDQDTTCLNDEGINIDVATLFERLYKNIEYNNRLA